ncbi:DUF3293 domain-containing protein [Deinococcus roseus]|uniref:DUF3293 domain-containing protein n=1 Tax=Deinococcus roseus TaxID=392414 RepID=A0ABQ2CZ10_9DEIO|nr:DUF3293 domain-containing protein [Deinococcus roseus]GGJ30764.1 hypothetical protein GCM10008938_16010 [Deinococcus roseus]
MQKTVSPAQVQALIQTYLSSPYTLQGHRLCLKDRPETVPVHFPERWAMVTACNPHSQKLAAALNQQRNAALSEAIQNLGCLFYGYRAGEGDWEEAGFLIQDISLAASVRLGKNFQQNAVLYGTGNRVALVWLEPLLLIRMWWGGLTR